MDSVINHLGYPLLHQQSAASDKRRENYFISLIDTLHNSVSKYHLVYVMKSSLKSSFLLFNIWNICEGNVQNTMFCKLL